MKRLLFLGALAGLSFVSCATDIKDWDAPDPNGSTMMAANITEPRAYSPDSIGIERQAMTDREMRDLTRKKDSGTHFSGELSVGVGSEF